MATYVNDLRLKEIATGDESGTWGTSTNTNLELIAEAFSFGTEAISTNAGTHTTTIADGSTDPGRSIYLQYTGTLNSTCTITIGPNTVSKLWFIENATSGSQSIIIKQGSGATVTIANGQVKAIYSDGAGSGGAMVDAFQDLSIPDLFIDDDLTFTSDSAVITFGADGDTTLTHTDGSGLTLNSTNKIMFNDASQFIQGSSATVLALGATDEIDLTATAIDVNGTMDVSGALTGTSATFGGITGSGSGTLKVKSNSSHHAIALEENSGNEAYSLGVEADGSLIFANSGSEAVRFDDSSNVGIGMTPVTALDINRATGSASYARVGNGGNVQAYIGVAGDNLPVLGSFTNHALRMTVNAAEVARFDTSGNFGVGTSSPAQKIHAQGTSGTTIIAERTGSNAGFSGIYGSNNPAVVWGGSSDSLRFAQMDDTSFTNFTERMRLTDTGDLLFAQTSGSAADVGHIMQQNGVMFHTASERAVMFLRRNNTDGTILQFRKNGTSVGTISTNANSLPSDRNFKNNISYDFALGLDFVTSLKPVTYNYKIDDAGAPVMSGLIAQDVEESLSAAGVEKNSMTLLQHVPTDDEEQSDYEMDYLKLVPVLIKSIQEQQKIITALETRIKTLENN